MYPAGATFADEAHLRRTIDKIVARVGRRVDEASPMVDARLPDGSRVNAVVPPVALDGSLLTIRKFAVEPLTVGHLIQFGTMTPQVADLLRVCVQGRLNIVIGGGTGSGKTTTLNVLSSFVPEDERIVTIEDAAELQLRQEHVLRLESRPANLERRGEITVRDLVRNAMRMRPDRIIVGEVRDQATLDMLQAMNTGHDGSITTIHSNSPRDTLSRMETMVMMANVELSQRAIRDQMASAIDLIVHQARLKDGSRRITQISEVQGTEGDIVMLQDLFVFDFHAGLDAHGRHRGRLQGTGLRPRFLNRLADRGIQVSPGNLRAGGGGAGAVTGRIVRPAHAHARHADRGDRRTGAARLRRAGLCPRRLTSRRTRSVRDQDRRRPGATAATCSPTTCWPRQRLDRRPSGRSRTATGASSRPSRRPRASRRYPYVGRPYPGHPSYSTLRYSAQRLQRVGRADRPDCARPRRTGSG